MPVAWSIVPCPIAGSVTGANREDAQHNQQKRASHVGLMSGTSQLLQKFKPTRARRESAQCWKEDKCMIRRLHVCGILALSAATGFAAYAQEQPAANPSGDSATAPDQGWPRQSSKNGTTLVAYQPQVDEWKDFKTLTFRMAFSITPKGGKPVLGAARISADTDVDNDAHMVLIHDLKIQRINFPSAKPEQVEPMSDLLRQFLPRAMDISLERVVACTPKNQTVPAVDLKNDPPGVFVSYKPAVLLDVDGDPV